METRSWPRRSVLALLLLPISWGDGTGFGRECVFEAGRGVTRSFWLPCGVAGAGIGGDGAAASGCFGMEGACESAAMAFVSVFVGAGEWDGVLGEDDGAVFDCATGVGEVLWVAWEGGRGD